MLYVAPLCLKYFRRCTKKRLTLSPESFVELLGIWLATLWHACGRTGGVSVRVSIIFRRGGGVPNPFRLCFQQILQFLPWIVSDLILMPAAERNN